VLGGRLEKFRGGSNNFEADPLRPGKFNLFDLGFFWLKSMILSSNFSTFGSNTPALRPSFTFL